MAHFPFTPIISKSLWMQSRESSGPLQELTEMEGSVKSLLLGIRRGDPDLRIFGVKNKETNEEAEPEADVPGGGTRGGQALGGDETFDDDPDADNTAPDLNSGLGNGDGDAEMDETPPEEEGGAGYEDQRNAEPRGITARLGPALRVPISPSEERAILDEMWRRTPDLDSNLRGFSETAGGTES
ncbi:hypothetical protein HDU93_002749 [Gonapodya sp. JEL0774]|nr:hypothetical protein HDU93_002749 [Gonapodya sp. JEL0774]